MHSQLLEGIHDRRAIRLRAAKEATLVRGALGATEATTAVLRIAVVRYRAVLLHRRAFAVCSAGLSADFVVAFSTGAVAVDFAGVVQRTLEHAHVLLGVAEVCLGTLGLGFASDDRCSRRGPRRRIECLKVDDENGQQSNEQDRSARHGEEGT